MPGADSAQVLWTPPVFDFPCSGGQAIQIGGQPLGSMFPMGWTCIAYQGQDDCGNVMDCHFCFEVIESSNSNLTSTSLSMVELGTAIIHGDQVRLDWVVSDELQNSEFVVERATNGLQFTPIATHSADGEAFYQLIDIEPATGNNRYRIRVVTENAMDRYSNMETEQITRQEGFRVYPNPAYANTVSVNLEAYNGLSCEVLLTTTLGQEVSKITTVANSVEPLRMDIKGLRDSVYYITVKPENGRSITKKLVITRA